MGLIYHFLTFKPKRMIVTTNDFEWNEEASTIAICNGRYYGGGYKVGYQSNLQNGLLDVYLVKKMKRLKMAMLIKGMNQGKHEKSPYTTKLQVKELKIQSDQEIESNIDGEKLTSKEFTVKIIPKGITIYYDQELIDEINRN